MNASAAEVCVKRPRLDAADAPEAQVPGRPRRAARRLEDGVREGADLGGRVPREERPERARARGT